MDLLDIAALIFIVGATIGVLLFIGFIALNVIARILHR